jgi:endonuclease III
VDDRQRRVTETLLASYGRTYAEEAGITLRDTPQPLYRTLVLASLLSARIRASVAVATARALYEAGLRDPRRMAESPRQRRIDALGAGGYRRYDERTATQLADGARLLTERWNGDLRRMRDEADGDLAKLRTLLRELPGIGPAGADIFLREVQRVWPGTAPYVDGKALSGARRLRHPEDADRQASLPGALDRRVAEDVLEAAG